MATPVSENKVKFMLTFEETKELLHKGNYVEVIEKLTTGFKSNEKSWKNPTTPQFKFTHRLRWLRRYKSWALPPTIEQLHELRDIIGDQRMLEIGAGSGLWAALLRCVGCNIIVTDSKSEPTCEYIDVEKLTSREALEKYGADVGCLFVSWGRGYPTEEEFKFFKGNLVISIGESGDGCTSSGYIDELDEDQSWQLLKIIDIPQWRGIWDTLIIYQRIAE